MSTIKALDDNKKLIVTYRVEGGCLGPIGHTHVDKFCDFAQEHIENKHSQFINLKIIPRHDKSLPEMQFNVFSKKVSHAQAEKYLAVFGQSLDDFEGELSEQLAVLIDSYAEKFIK